MSSVSPLSWQQPSPVAGVTPTTMASPAPTAYLQGTLDGVASLLSLPAQDIRSALGQGSSLTEIAASKGVSRDTLVQTIEQSVRQQRSQQGLPPVDQAALDQAVGRAVDRHRHHHHHRGAESVAPPAALPGPGASSTVDTLA